MRAVLHARRGALRRAQLEQPGDARRVVQRAKLFGAAVQPRVQAVRRVHAARGANRLRNNGHSCVTHI